MNTNAVFIKTLLRINVDIKLGIATSLEEIRKTLKMVEAAGKRGENS